MGAQLQEMREKWDYYAEYRMLGCTKPHIPPEKRQGIWKDTYRNGKPETMREEQKGEWHRWIEWRK